MCNTGAARQLMKIAAKYAMEVFRVLHIHLRRGDNWLLLDWTRTFIGPGDLEFFETEEEALFFSVRPGFIVVPLHMIHHTVGRRLRCNDCYPVTIFLDLNFLLNLY